jgi:hypothetical protein
MGLAHPSQAKCMHALLLGSLLAGRLIRKRRNLVAHMGHYWKLKFSNRGKTDREKQNTDRKIGILIFFYRLTDRKTPQGLSDREIQFFCRLTSFRVSSPIFLLVQCRQENCPPSGLECYLCRLRPIGKISIPTGNDFSCRFEIVKNTAFTRQKNSCFPIDLIPIEKFMHTDRILYTEKASFVCCFIQ